MAKAPKAPIIDHELIRELTKLLEETGLTEIEIEQDGQRVRVARNAAPGPQPAAPRADGGWAAAGRAIGGSGARSVEASGRRALAHGRHRLCRARAGRQAVHRDRQPR